MERNVCETDWKHFRWLHPIALERFSKGVIAEVAALAADASKAAHARFLALTELLEQRQVEASEAFDDQRRSSAFVQIARIRVLGTITDEEFARFAPETQEAVAIFLELWGS